ncbi:hypothetical protein NST99_05950 [Paenibacillus sp. FSL L8-0470]|uniref:hypothetical protein n=1 Tax=unclassified Paenibacillus TaxID=185978 RepID=UPI0030F81CD4
MIHLDKHTSVTDALNHPPLKVRGSLIRREDITSACVDVFGHLKALGRVTTGRLKVSGECSITGACLTAKVENFGSLRLHSLQAEHIRSSGYFAASEAIHTLTFLGEGAVRVNSLSAKESITVLLGSSCTADQIRTDGTLIVRRSSLLLKRLMGPFRKLTARLIQGGAIELEYTTAELVCGEQIRVGPGCDIQEIRYSGSLHVDPKSKVGRAVHTNGSGGPVS